MRAHSPSSSSGPPAKRGGEKSRVWTLSGYSEFSLSSFCDGFALVLIWPGRRKAREKRGPTLFFLSFVLFCFVFLHLELIANTLFGRRGKGYDEFIFSVRPSVLVNTRVFFLIHVLFLFSLCFVLFCFD